MKTRHLIQKLYGGFAWMAVLVMAGYSIAQAAPTIYGVYSYDGLTAGVQFSVPVDPTTATAVANYAVSGTTVTNVTLMPDGASVALGLSVPISGQFVVTVNNVEDTSLNPIAPNSTATNNVLNLVITPFGDADPANGGQPYSATYTGGYATLIAGGSDLYGNGDNFVFENMPVTNDFDYCMKIPLVGPDGQPFDRSGLMVRDLTNDMYAHEILVSHNAGPNAGNSAADSAQVTLRFALDYTASTTYSEPPNPLPAFYGSNSWVRLQRSGNIFTCYYASNGVHWLRLYQFDGSSNRTPDGITGAAVDGMFTNAVLYLGMATCAHNSAVDTTNIVSDLGPTPLAPVRIYTQPPATMIFRQNVPAQISVGAGGVPDPVYQWLTNGVPIPGATNATYNVASPQPSDAGTYSVLVSNYFSSVLSSNCVVTYSADTTPPTIVGVYSFDGLTVGVQFNKPMGAGITTTNNYTVTGATVIGAALGPDGQSAILTLGSAITASFTVTVNNVQDSVGNTVASNSQAVGSVLNLAILPFGDATNEPYSATYYGNFATLVAGGEDLWDIGDNFVFEYLAVTNDFDYCAKVVSISNDGQVWDRSGLMVRDSLTDIYSHMILNARNAGPNAGNTAPDSAQVTIRYTMDTANFTYSEPGNPLPAFYGSNSWVRLQRTGNVFTTYYSSNGMNWAQLYQFDGSATNVYDTNSATMLTVDGMFTNSVLYLGLASCAHGATLVTTNIMADLAPLLPPTITTQPKAEELYAGQTTRLSVSAYGSPYVIYQWQVNGTNIPGATNMTLNVPLTTSGTYDVVVSTPAGESVTSSVVTLTAVTPTKPYEKAVLALGPVAYWRLNETDNPSGGATAYDYVSALNGPYGAGCSNGFTSVAGPGAAAGFNGFGINNTALQSFNGTANSYVSGGALNLNTNAATFVAWVKPIGTQNGAAGVLMCRGGSTPGTGLAYVNSGALGLNWNNGQWWWGGLSAPPANVWSLVALVMTPTNGTVYIVNSSGLRSATDNFTVAIQAFDAPFIVGSDPYNYTQRAFNGSIDEVAVFNYTLTQTNIQQLYQAGVSPLTIGPSGSNVIVNWNPDSGFLVEGTTLVGGSWTTNSAAPPYTNTPAAAQKFYRLQLQ